MSDPKDWAVEFAALAALDQASMMKHARWEAEIRAAVFRARMAERGLVMPEGDRV